VKSSIPLSTIDRLAYRDTVILPVVIMNRGRPVKAHIYFDLYESQRFPGQIGVLISEEKGD
jgi:hypothetical protein